MRARRQFLIAAARLSSDRFVGREGGEIDEVGDRGAHLDDLRGLGKPHDQRPHVDAAAGLTPSANVDPSKQPHYDVEGARHELAPELAGRPGELVQDANARRLAAAEAEMAKNRGTWKGAP